MSASAENEKEGGMAQLDSYEYDFVKWEFVTAWPSLGYCLGDLLESSRVTRFLFTTIVLPESEEGYDQPDRLGL